MTGWGKAAGGAQRRKPDRGTAQHFPGGRGEEGGCPGGAGALLFSAAFLMPASSSGASGLSPIRSNLWEQRRLQLLEDLGWPWATPSTPFPPPQTHQEGITIFMLSVTGIRGLRRDSKKGRGAQER